MPVVAVPLQLKMPEYQALGTRFRQQAVEPDHQRQLQVGFLEIECHLHAALHCRKIGHHREHGRGGALERLPHAAAAADNADVGIVLEVIHAFHGFRGAL